MRCYSVGTTAKSLPTLNLLQKLVWKYTKSQHDTRPWTILFIPVSSAILPGSRTAYFVSFTPSPRSSTPPHNYILCGHPKRQENKFMIWFLSFVFIQSFPIHLSRQICRTSSGAFLPNILLTEFPWMTSENTPGYVTRFPDPWPLNLPINRIVKDTREATTEGTRAANDIAWPSQQSQQVEKLQGILCSSSTMTVTLISFSLTLGPIIVDAISNNSRCHLL